MTEDVEELQAEVVRLRKTIVVLKENVTWQASENKALKADRDNLQRQLDLLGASFVSRHTKEQGYL